MIIMLGMIFRLVNLDSKVYWGDEVYSSLRIFGYTTVEVVKEIAIGRPIAANVIQKFQHLDINLSIIDVINTLKTEDTHLVPLYFMLGHIWAKIWGDSATAIRLLSVLFSLLILPSIYWLAMELFQTKHVAAITTAITAITPIQIVFAQEARFYSLWLLLSILSAASLLWAARSVQMNRWITFTVILIACFYTNLLSTILWVGLTLYVGLRYRRDRSTIVRFALSSLTAWSALTPWLWMLLHREQVPMTRPDDTASLTNFVYAWWTNTIRLFVDLDSSVQLSRIQFIALLACVLIGFVLLSRAWVYLWGNAPRHVAGFITIISLIMPVALLGRAFVGILPPRYLLLTYTMLQLPIAYFLGQLWQRQALKRTVDKIWIIMALVILGSYLISIFTMLPAQTWWNKQPSECNPVIAQLVNQSNRPLVIGEGDGGKFFDHALSNLISLARLTKPQAEFQIVLPPQVPVIPDQGYSDRFVVMPSATLVGKLAQQYPGKMIPLLESSLVDRGSQVCLWRLASD
jgi:uncharacterized membrane protein